MKKNNSLFRWIVWALTFVMSINSIGTIVLASEETFAESAEMVQETEEPPESEEIPPEGQTAFNPAEEFLSEGEGVFGSGEEMLPEGESAVGSGEESLPENEGTVGVVEALPEGEADLGSEGELPPEGNINSDTEMQTPEEEIFSSGDEISPEEEIPPEFVGESLPEGETLPEGEPSQEEETLEQQEAAPEQLQVLSDSQETYELNQDYDINFYVIYEKEKYLLQQSGISGVKTWEDGRTTYHGVSVDDLISVYKEFGFVKGSDGQNPDAVDKFVSANRGKNGIEYGEVYTDSQSGKTYVSYNYDYLGQNRRGNPVDVYYLPKGRLGNPLLGDNVKKANSFYSVEVKGEGQDQRQYALYESTFEIAVSDYNPKLPEQTDRIEWTCFGTNDTVIDGTIEPGNRTKFTINNISQSYVIQRADKTEFDIQFYVYVDNEIRRLPSDSLKKVYKWNSQGRSYLSVSDLEAIYREYGLKATDKQFGSYFPYAVRGGKTLAHAAMATYKGKQYVSYTLENQYNTVATDIYYMPKGSEKTEQVPVDQVDASGNITSSVADQLKQNRHSFYSVTVIQTDGSRSVTYHKKDEDVTISVDPGETKADEWLCASEDGEKTIPPAEKDQKLEFTIQQIEQPYTIACNTFSPETLNIKFYTFVDYERYNVEQAEVPVLKDTTKKPGTTYYYISNKELTERLKKFHYDGAIQNGSRERFYYSKRDYDTIHNAGKDTQNGQDCIYIGKTGEPMDVYYLPDGQLAPILNVKTLIEYTDDRYNGFYSVTVQDEDGQVYDQNALRDLPQTDFVARKTSLTRTVSTKPRVEGQTGEVTWECRKEDGTFSGIVGIKNEQDHTMSFTISADDAVRPYVIVPDNTAKPAERKEANISFYVFIDGDYKLVKNINAEQHYITKDNSGYASRYYLRAGKDDTISQVYKEFGFTPDKLEPGPDNKEKILFGYATDSRVFVQHPHKDNDGTWYIPVLKNGHDVSVYYFSQPNPLDPDRIENYFDRLTGLSAQIGVVGQRFDVGGSFHLVEVLDPLNLTKGQAVLRQYVAHGENYSVEVPKKATLEGEYQGKDIEWSCTSNDRDAFDVPPTQLEEDKLQFRLNNIGYSYQIVADKPQEPDTVRVVYDTTRYMKKFPKEAKLTPQVGNKTRFSEDIPENKQGTYTIKSPYPLTYDHEDNDSKELEMYEFDHWDYRDSKGHWRECDSGTLLSAEVLNDSQKPIIFYAAWRKISDRNRKQVQFYICKSAMPEDGSISLPSVKPEDYTSAVAVATCNESASLLHDVPVLGNKNPTLWEHYANGHKRVMELLQGTRPDEGYIGNGNYIYKIDRIPSDEEVFQTIRESGRKIRIGEREIPADKLDTEFFTIYWYSFKSELSDGWHIDGRIVAKNGYMTVQKDFVGQTDAIEAVKKNYYIGIDMDERLSDGTIQPPAFHQHMKLVLPTEGEVVPSLEVPAAEDAPAEIVGVWDDKEHTSCTWTVKADPFWKYTLKEYNYQPTDSTVQFSGWYNVHNSHEAGENVNTWELYPENGIKFTGRGMGRGGESLTIELENRYQKPGMLTLNKFDGSTGLGLKEITFDVSLDGAKKDPVTTDKNGIAEIEIPLQDESGQNRTATETYLLRETNVPTGYIDTGDVQITVAIKDGAFKITEAKLVDRKAEGSQEGVTAPPDGAVDGKHVLTLRGETSLNIRNFSKTSALHIKKIWENRNDALTEKQVKVRLYRDGISTGQEFLLNEDNGWEYTVDKVPLFLDKKPVEYKIEEVEIGKTHYSPEFGDGFLYYEVIYPEIQYKDADNKPLSPSSEEEFKNIARIELEVQNLHFNLAERSFLKTDDLPRDRLEGAEFTLYKVHYDAGKDQYESDKDYTVEAENGQIVLKKDGVPCQSFITAKTDAKGMLTLPLKDVPNGRYWMVESLAPNKTDITKVQYKDNLALYMADIEDEILFLYERSIDTKEWKPLTDRHIVNHPQKGGVTVHITKEVTGPFGDRDKSFDVKISYKEDGMKMNKEKEATVKNGQTITIDHVALNSDMKITEMVDTSKYAVSLSRKSPDETSGPKTNAQPNGNNAVVTQKITGNPGDVIELTLTNQNIEDADPDTGIHLEKKLYVWMLIIISFTTILFFRERRKSRRDRD